QFVVYEPNATAVKLLRASLDAAQVPHAGQVVRDRLALQLVLKHSIPHTFFFAGDDDATCKLIRQLFATKHTEVAKVKRIAIVGNGLQARDVNWQERVGFQPDGIISRPCAAAQIFEAIDNLADTPQAEADTTSRRNAASILMASDRQDIQGLPAGAGS